MRNRSRPKRLLLSVLLVSLVGILALTSCEVRGGVYGLNADSQLQEGCFPPLACPVLIAESIGGTFRLTEAPFAAPSLFDTFLVTDVYWLTRLGGEDVPITGSGTYIRGGEFALMNRLQLDLRVGDQEVQSFDSGLVVVGSGADIDIRISIHGEQFFDTVIDVRAIRFPADPGS
jgi:hypothetical protein